MVVACGQGGDVAHAITSGDRRMGWYRKGHAIALDVARALCFLHSHNVVHGAATFLSVASRHMSSHVQGTPWIVARTVVRSIKPSPLQFGATLSCRRHQKPEHFADERVECEGVDPLPVPQTLAILLFGQAMGSGTADGVWHPCLEDFHTMLTCVLACRWGMWGFRVLLRTTVALTSAPCPVRSLPALGAHTPRGEGRGGGGGKGGGHAVGAFSCKWIS